MPVGVLFVCLGNICRSPIAQGVLERKARRLGLQDAIFADSCGTAAFNVGKPADPRARSAASAAGYDLGGQIARQIEDSDYARFHYIIAMDRTNLINLKAWRPATFEGEIRLLMDYCQHDGSSQIPDPFYQSADRFAELIPVMERAVDGLLAHIRHQHSL